MTKSEFQDLLHRYSRSTRQEAEQVLLLEREYPYSQLLHSLAARVSKDHNFENQQSKLQQAAVYAADRHVLKEIMSSTQVVSTANGDSTVVATDASSALDEHDYADEVMHDLEVLSESRHTFEMLFTDDVIKENSDVKTPAKKVKATPVKKKAKSAPVKKKVVVKKAKATKVTKKKAAKKTTKPTSKVVAKKKVKAPVKPKKKTLLKKKDSGDSLIVEIENTKRELRPESPKQQEQLQIIDQFIKAQPSISNARERAASVPTGDLASYKQGEFSDQIISETLVDILINQGKKDKAIDVLKKLIWKFPQKKAYFAAQIQELKK